METFPNKFFARNVQSDIDQNRVKKIEQELRIIRNKIVDSFQSSVSYHSEIQHDLLPDLSEDEQKGFYCMIKDELSQRGFTVRGKCSNGQLQLIIFSNEPRTSEMDRVLRQTSETIPNSSIKKSRSSSVDAHVIRPRAASTPSSSSVSSSSSLSNRSTPSKPPGPGSRIRSSSVQKSSPGMAKSSRTVSTPASPSLHNSVLQTKSRIPVFQKHPTTKTTAATTTKCSISKPTSSSSSPSSLSSLPSLHLKSSSSMSLSTQSSQEAPKLPSPSPPSLTTSLPQEPLFLVSTHTIDEQTWLTSPAEKADLNTSIELNMDFILERLKKANEKRQNANKANKANA